MNEDIKRRVYGIGRPVLEKKAAGGLWAAVMGVPSTLINAAGSVVGGASAYLLGAALLAGAGMGWGAAKLTSKGKRDIETVKKGYDNERLKADIGYLQAKLKQEQADASITAPKAARIFN